MKKKKSLFFPKTFFKHVELLLQAKSKQISTLSFQWKKIRTSISFTLKIISFWWIPTLVPNGRNIDSAIAWVSYSSRNKHDKVYSGALNTLFTPSQRFAFVFHLVWSPVSSALYYWICRATLWHNHHHRLVIPMDLCISFYSWFQSWIWLGGIWDVILSKMCFTAGTERGSAIFVFLPPGFLHILVTKSPTNWHIFIFESFSFFVQCTEKCVNIWTFISIHHLYKQGNFRVASCCRVHASSPENRVLWTLYCYTYWKILWTFYMVRIILKYEICHW